MNPFSTVFHEVGAYQLCDVEMVTVPLEEYEHLLLRVETAERMYEEMKAHYRRRFATGFGPTSKDWR